ncbi:hereditary hemochromatosis protein homolog [Ctenopharyngodon idella]|uniref:hereditary hemochromatosis protein homolog n=1 Tax=Ctenopharyngodon idella TaxID=7959 RepID=UPI0022302B26|nr:hereditary hemochromatosis protein homolog [Ctenopharyngodon idella]
MIKLLVFLCVLQSAPTTVSTGSHSLRLLVTYIKGETTFPEFSVTFMLDDITVGHYNSETKRYIPRDNATNEDEIISYIFYAMRHDLHPVLMRRLTFKNYTESVQLYQVMSHCELWDNDKPGQMISKFAFSGSTTDEIRLYDNKFTYESPKEMATLSLELVKWRHETINYPCCIATLRNYLKKRKSQVNKKVKPRVRLIQKANTNSGGSRVSCLATGFYPRHINLTLFRDGQPVSDHEITGGDLLPNGDGTYQMRKSLEISADKHKYTCSATHLSLDNKLDATLEFDPGEPFKSVIPSVLIVSAVMLVFGTGAVIYKYRRQAASSKGDYSSASTSEESTDTKST